MLVDRQIGNGETLTAPATSSPAPADATHVRITARDGNSNVDIASTPAASEGRGLLYLAGAVDARPVRTGDKVGIFDAG